jgi:hypothetical protein
MVDKRLIAVNNPRTFGVRPLNAEGVLQILEIYTSGTRLLITLAQGHMTFSWLRGGVSYLDLLASRRRIE